MSKIRGTVWQPVGAQFYYACRICSGKDCTDSITTCRDCRMEVKSGFEFDPVRYMDLAEKLIKEERWFFDGKKYHPMVDNREEITRLEKRLLQEEMEKVRWKCTAEWLRLKLGL